MLTKIEYTRKCCSVVGFTCYFLWSDLGSHGEEVNELSVQTFVGSATSGTSTTELHTVSTRELDKKCKKSVH